MLSDSAVKQDIQQADDEAIKVKEQAILEVGKLYADDKNANGKWWRVILLDPLIDFS